MRRARAFLALVGGAAVLAAAAPAAGETQRAGGLRNDRYCELLELRGAPPTGRVNVWNTIGFNRCPSQWWRDLDPAAIAAERDATLVLRNGPRHWLMDSARGRVGRSSAFGGRKLRHVATVPVRTAADLAQTPYAEREIGRTNTWRWRKGRRVFELRSPEGDRYVMQSYAQIVDPALTLADLPALGGRLELPEGWSYGMRRLRRPLVLRAGGNATIVQDELKNTYQRLPPAGERHEVAMTGRTKLAGMSAPGVLHDRGTVTGAPFGGGSIDIFVSFESGGLASASFRIDTRRGSVDGDAELAYTIAGGEIEFEGTADVTGGTGRYRRISGEDLRVRDTNTLDGQNGRVSFDGHVFF